MNTVQSIPSIHSRVMTLLGHLLASDLVTDTFRRRIEPLTGECPAIQQTTDLDIEEAFLALLVRDGMNWGADTVGILDVTLSKLTQVRLSGLIALAARCVWAQPIYRLAKPLTTVDLSGVTVPPDHHDRNRLLALQRAPGLRMGWHETALRYSDNEHRSASYGLEHDEEIFGVLAGGGFFSRVISTLNLVPALLRVHDEAGALYDPTEEFRGVLLPGEILRLRILLRITGEVFPPHEAIQAVERVLNVRLNGGRK